MSKLTNALHSIVGKNHVLALLNIVPLEGSMHGSSITDKVFLKIDSQGNVDFAESEADATHFDYAMAKLMQSQLTQQGYAIFNERGVSRNGVPVTIIPGEVLVASGIFRVNKNIFSKVQPETQTENKEPMRSNNSNFDADLPVEQPDPTVRHYRILSPIGWLGADGAQKPDTFEVTLADGYYEGVWSGDQVTVATRTGATVSFQATPAKSKPIPVKVTVVGARATVR